MIHISKLLQHYKREDVQNAILESAQDREIAIKYGDKFGNRPDILKYKRDILEAAKQGATSFHASEELWKDPLRIDTLMKKKDLDELRLGWDLVLDIDCKDWGFSKLITYLFIKALKYHEISNISCKFSGNVGFHIGISFDSFPKEVNNVESSSLFPEGPRRIAKYLLEFISENYVKVKDNIIIFNNKYEYTLDDIKKKFGKKEFIINKCIRCGNKVNLKKKKNEFVCKICGKEVKSQKEFMSCDKCKILMDKIKLNKKLCKCGSNEYEFKFNPLSIIEVDTLLISQRHLYRMPYCFNEKSGLISVPINPDKVLEFKKDQAKPPIVISAFKFLDKSNKDQAKNLILQAFDFTKKQEEIKEEYEEYTGEAIPEQFFPPCVKKLLAGVKDGKKRGMFILSNFLSCTGYNYDQIEKILKEWHKKNKERLRENYFVGQLRYFKTQNKKVPPPNCKNMMYYKDIAICHPDNLCNKIKNPVNYTRRKTYYLNKGKKKK